jgi:hypothetical protein
MEVDLLNIDEMKKWKDNLSALGQDDLTSPSKYRKKQSIKSVDWDNEAFMILE